MAKGKKSEKVLTLEEKLEQALVPVEEQPYPVPENWCWTRLDRVARWGSGGTPSRKKSCYYGGHIPWIKTGELNDGYVFQTEETITDEALVHSSVKLYPINTVMMAMYGATIGKVGIMGIEATTNQACACAICSSAINYMYLFYFLLSQKNFFINKAKGGAQPNISQEIIKARCIPLSPLMEQQRIVNCIESLFAKLDGVKEKAQAMIDGFETRKATILHRAFTGELTAQWRNNNYIEASLLLRQIDEEICKTKRKTINKVINVIDKNNMRVPSNWVIVDLDRISKKITDGEHKTPNRVDSYSGYYLLSARNIYNDLLKLEDVDYVDENEYGKISKRCNPQKGDVLISCSGSVGRACVIDDENKYCMVRSVAMVSISKCNARYVMYAIQSDTVQHQIKRLSKQTAQANLFIGAIAAISIPLPPIEEQTEIVRIIDNTITKEVHAKNIAEDMLSQIDTMKKSILTRAFRGELGTNDLSEESAMELLKSIL